MLIGPLEGPVGWAVDEFAEGLTKGLTGNDPIITNKIADTPGDATLFYGSALRRVEEADGVDGSRQLQIALHPHGPLGGRRAPAGRREATEGGGRVAEGEPVGKVSENGHVQGGTNEGEHLCVLEGCEAGIEACGAADDR